MMTFEDDVAYFMSINAELAKEHKGKFVLIKDKQVVGIFSNIEDAHRDALKRFGVTDVVIESIGLDAPVNYMASAVS